MMYNTHASRFVVVTVKHQPRPSAWGSFLFPERGEMEHTSDSFPNGQVVVDITAAAQLLDGAIFIFCESSPGIEIAPDLVLLTGDLVDSGGSLHLDFLLTFP